MWPKIVENTSPRPLQVPHLIEGFVAKRPRGSDERDASSFEEKIVAVGSFIERDPMLFREGTLPK